MKPPNIQEELKYLEHRVSQYEGAINRLDDFSDPYPHHRRTHLAKFMFEAMNKIDKIKEYKMTDIEQAQQSIKAIKETLEKEEQRLKDLEEPKRWRAEYKHNYQGNYVSITDTGVRVINNDAQELTHNTRHRLGNYFNSLDDAQNSLIYHALNSDYDYYLPGCGMEMPVGIIGLEFWPTTCNDEKWVSCHVSAPYNNSLIYRWPKTSYKG